MQGQEKMRCEQNAVSKMAIKESNRKARETNKMVWVILLIKPYFYKRVTICIGISIGNQAQEKIRCEGNSCLIDLKMNKLKHLQKKQVTKRNKKVLTH